jgi:hypothetical protein
MSMANNHTVDLGHRVMLDTAELLRKQGVRVVGAGRDLTEARTPALVETNRRKIAYLAYASVFPNGYEAREGWPLMPLHPDARMTMLAWAEIGDEASPAAAGFLPCTIAPDGLVHPHDPESEEGARVVDYVRQACRSQNLEVDLVQDEEHILGGFSTIRVEPASSGF